MRTLGVLMLLAVLTLGTIAPALAKASDTCSDTYNSLLSNGPFCSTSYTNPPTDRGGTAMPYTSPYHSILSNAPKPQYAPTGGPGRTAMPYTPPYHSILSNMP
jgi:hypothetical protein